MTKKKATKKTQKRPAKKLERDPKTGRIKKGVAQDTNKNGTAGAPSKYHKKYCQQMIEFFSGDKSRRELIEETVTQSKWGQNTTKKWKYFANDTPFFEAFARKIGVSYATLYNWAFEKGKDNKPKRPEFFEAYNTCKQLQFEFLVDNGLSGLYPPASFIFVAKNITHLKDSSELSIKKKKEEEISDEELEEAIFGS